DRRRIPHPNIQTSGPLPTSIQPGGTSESCEWDGTPMKVCSRFSAVATTAWPVYDDGPTTSNCTYASLTAAASFRNLPSHSCGKPSGEKPNAQALKPTGPR